jgi:cobalt-zinc-cadmium resistance protein CzcA
VIPSDNQLRLIEFPVIPDSSALIGNPLLKYWMQQVKVAMMEKKLEQSQMLPDLNVGFFSQTMIGSQEIDGTSSVFGKEDRFTGVQAGIAIPLWIKPYNSRNKAANISLEKAKTDADNYLKSVTGAWLSLLDDYKKFSSSVYYYEKQAVPEAELIIEQANKSYKAGALDYLDYVQTLNRALSIRQSYLDALHNCNQTIISTEFIMGKLF